MRRLTPSALLAVALALLNPTHHVAAAELASCYGGSVPAPPVRKQTILLIDETAAPDPDVVEAYIGAVARSASGPGQRLVIHTFSALAHDQGVAKRFDGVIEAPITDPDVVENLPIKPFKKSQRCVKDRAVAWPAQVEAAIRATIDDASHRRNSRRSEIVYSLSALLKTYGNGGIEDTTLWVLSDGYEAGSLGVSMYGKDGKPRVIDARVELARLPRQIRPPLVRDGSWTVMWFGLMSGADRPQGRHLDVQSIQQVRAFWESLLVEDWGVRSAVIDRIPLSTGTHLVRWRKDLRASGLRFEGDR